MKQCKKILMSMLILAGSVLTVQAQLLPPGTTSKNTPSNSQTNSAFMDGLDYKLLSSPQPTESKGKIEVTEFFWYACPHCYDLEPEIQAWVKRQKNDVVFKRVPIAFRDDFLPHSQIFYALEALGKEAEYSPKVMKAIHVDRKQLLKEDEIFNWATSVGLDTAAFTTAYKSFSVQTKAKTANATSSAYRVNGVPTIFVQGKYETSPSIAGTKARAIDTLDYLVGKARTEKK
jgi:thiol:disulfide interchange protein DsbA